ncbi:hypothetical protein HYT55_03625 [Candidatus Woesearchaeota archaeon]|nr:hypothetical protein [Candidatus Woesearchaeota archaeon]
MVYLARRQKSGFKVEGANENYLKSQYVPVPESLSDLLPDQNVRLVLRNGLGFYNGFCPPMVSVYLVPTNDLKKRERTLVETVILTPTGNSHDQVRALKENRGISLTGREVRTAVESCIYEILFDYIARGNIYD